MTAVHKTLFRLFTRGQQRSAVWLLGLMLIGMMLETLGVGLVIPALSVMTIADPASEYPTLSPWLAALGNPTRERLAIAGMLTMVSVYVAKTVFLAFLAWKQAAFVASLQVDFSQRLFAAYLNQPYAFHLQRNSAQLIRTTVGQVAELASVVQQGLLLLAELSAIIGISLLLFLVEPVGASVVVSTLGLAGWGFSRASRARIHRWGADRQHHEVRKLQHIQQGLGAAKDVILLGRASDFLERFRLHSAGSARAGQLQAFLQALPRLWLEMLSVVGLAALVLVFIAQGKPFEALFPIVGLFGAAAFRLMPSVNRILAAGQVVRFSLPVIESLQAEVELLDATPAPRSRSPLPFTRALTVDRVGYCYAGSNVQVLRDVSLSIERGTSVGLVGGSGAGKSTLVDIILGLLTPQRGSVMVDGVDIQGNIRGWQDQIGYVPQSIFLTDDTIRRNVAFGISNDQIDEVAVRRAIRAAQLDQFVADLPDGLDSVVGERGVRVSGGQRQRIGIARALYHDPPVLLLDEATSSLDTATERGVIDAVRALQGDKTILIVAHRLSTVEHCSRLLRLEAGSIVEVQERASLNAGHER